MRLLYRFGHERSTESEKHIEDGIRLVPRICEIVVLGQVGWVRRRIDQLLNPDNHSRRRDLRSPLSSHCL
jgi:hypothetical protein